MSPHAQKVAEFAQPNARIVIAGYLWILLDEACLLITWDCTAHACPVRRTIAERESMHAPFVRMARTSSQKASLTLPSVDWVRAQNWRAPANKDLTLAGSPGILAAADTAASWRGGRM